MDSGKRNLVIGIGVILILILLAVVYYYSKYNTFVWCLSTIIFCCRAIRCHSLTILPARGRQSQLGTGSSCPTLRRRRMFL